MSEYENAFNRGKESFERNRKLVCKNPKNVKQLVKDLSKESCNRAFSREDLKGLCEAGVEKSSQAKAFCSAKKE